MVGFGLAALTGWVIALVITPVLALGLPYLLVVPKPRDVELMEALDRWVRSLAATLATGRSVTDAIRVSRRTAPPLIADEVGTLVLRLNNRWETDDALRRFADELDSADADGVVAALMLAAQPRRQRGVADPAGPGRLAAGAAQIPAGDRGRALEAVRGGPAGDGHLAGHPGSGSTCCPRTSSRRTGRRSARSILAVLLVLYLTSLILMRRKAQQAPAGPDPGRSGPMTTSLVLLAGILLAAGLVCLVAAVVPAVPRLDAALERVGAEGPTARVALLGRRAR